MIIQLKKNLIDKEEMYLNRVVFVHINNFQYLRTLEKIMALLLSFKGVYIFKFKLTWAGDFIYILTVTVAHQIVWLMMKTTKKKITDACMWMFECKKIIDNCRFFFWYFFITFFPTKLIYPLIRDNECMDIISKAGSVG